MPHTERDADVIIIGAGLAGLTAAKLLKQRDFKVLVIDAADAVGGRVRTDEVDGFLLDRGFQVLLPAYPEAKKILDYEALDLKPLVAGAMILNERGLYTVADPLRHPQWLLKTLFSAVGSWRDMFKILKLKLNLGAADLDTIFSRPEVSTRLYLQQMGFSQRIINQFFIPFFTGIFLEKNLDTSSRKFEFVFKMFSQAPAAVPAKGMGAIAKQLAAVLSANELLLNEQVIQIKDDEVFTFSGKILRAKAILIATAATGMPLPYTVQNAPGQTVTNLYFKTPKPPTQDAILMLNASENKVVNNLVVMDKVSKHYAPAGQSLLSVSLIGNWQGVPDDELIHRVLEELKQWFTDAPKWQHLKTYHIPYALPTDDTVSNNIEPDKLKLGRFHYICGDHLLNGSINAAIKSGRLAAELILNDIVS